MNWLQKIARLFTMPASNRAGNFYTFTVQCSRCGEQIRGQVDFRNQLSAEYDEAGRLTHYFCRRVLIGDGRCFQQIEVEFQFDPDHKAIERKIRGGQFIEETLSS